METTISSRWAVWRWTSISLAAAALAAGAPAAACDVQLQELPGTLVVEHDPFATVASTAPLRLLLRNVGDARRLELLFDTGSGALLTLPGPRGAIAFTLRENELLQPTTGTEGQHFLLLAEADSSLAPSLDLLISGDSVPRPGLYTGPVRLQIRDQSSGVPCREPLDIPIQVLVPSRAQLNIAGASGPITDGPGLNLIDFGSLVAGSTRTVYLQLRANGDAMVAMSSREGGVMRHTELPEHAATYSLLLDGRPVDLATRTEFLAPSAASIAGISLPMLFTIGSVDGLPAGQYEDVITISISAL